MLRDTTHSSGEPSRPEEKERPARGIRFQLLVTLNVLIGTGLALLLVLDYRRERDERVAVASVALQEEAKTILPAVRRLQREGWDAVQEHIDLVCGRMQDSSSPGHHIVVEIGGRVLQARAHHRESPEILDAVRLAAGAADHRARFDDDAIVVGTDSDGDATVYVSEKISNVLRATRRHLLQRAAMAGGLALVAVLVVNLILLRLVIHPLRRLVGTVRQIGEGALGAQAGVFKTAELRFVAGEVNAMSAALAAAEEARRLMLAKAERIQAHLNSLPSAAPGVGLSHLHRPADEVGGDYFDLVPLGDEASLLCVADVAGHGVPAALVAAVLKTLLAAGAEHHADPAEILGFVNQRLREVTLQEDFVTAALVRLDVAHGAIVYASAGHVPGLLLRPGQPVVELASTGTILGVQGDATWRAERLSVGPGSRLLLFTDGVTEARSPDGRFFEVQGVKECAEQGADLPLSDVVQCIETRLLAHRGGKKQDDDVTVVAVELL